MGLHGLEELELDEFGEGGEFVDEEVALEVADEERGEGWLVVQGSDCVAVELEAAVVLGLLQEDDLALSAVKPAGNHYLLVDGSRRQHTRQFLQVQAHALPLQLVLHLQLLR